ncbi:MAG: hypothetical protein EPO10_22770 [Reyranella sp.]|nr:MAG: hypothetical protein EPO10_22770 [Reyranella sp.]
MVNGVDRRPPTEHVARISATSFGDAFLHTINRDEDRRYSVVITDGDLRVFDLATGTEKTVNFPNGKGYLTASTPETSFACSTIADFTFVMNREVAVGEENAGNTVDNSLWVYVKQAFYNCSYGVYVDGVLHGTHTTAATGNQPQTDVIAGALASALTSSLGAGWTITHARSVVRIKKNDNSVHSIESYDSQGNNALVSFGRSIQNFVDLPPNAFGNTIVEVSGNTSNAFDSYWVSYNSTKQAWEETVKPEDEARPDPDTMPWKLTHELDDTFTFDKIDWGWRVAGDASSAPTPSLVGRTVNDIYIHRNRLFILADQNAIGSRPGGENFFELYPATATTSLDSDPIDVGLSSKSDAVPIARYAVGFADDLMIFTAPGQFRLGGGDILTASTVKASESASYTTMLTARPATNGKLIHFAIEKGSDSGIREGFVDTNSEVFEAPDITVHVPSYIRGKVRQLVSAINFDTLFLRADGALNKVWVYKWFIENNEKLQSSWSTWVFPEDDKVLSLSYIDGSLYLMIERATGVFLERLRLDVSYADPGLTFSIRLDRKASVLGTYDSGTGYTTWTLPYDLTGLTPIGVYGSAFSGKAGFQLPALTIVDAAAGTVRLPGNLTDGQCHFGVRYTYRYRPSTIYFPLSAGDKRSVITDGRLQLRHLFINYSNTGFFRVVVSQIGRDPFTYTFTPNVVGQTFVVGTPQFTTGAFRVPVRAENTKVSIDITSDSHYPCSILSFDWEGEFTLRSRRV